MSRNQGDEYKIFLDRLKQARRGKNFTQKDVALKLMKPQSYVSKFENGERRLDVIELAQLARLYEKPLEFFVELGRRES